MRKAILIVLGVLATIILIFCGVVASRPSEFKITRSATIDAPPETVFAHVNDFHQWNAWSPWMELDPDAKSTFDGPTSGPGAKFGWSGNDKIGEGDMEILEATPAEKIKIKLHFVRPMEDTCEVYFTFKPQGDKTEVVWDMAGKQNFVGKAFCMFMDMDAMVGGDFEKGLAKMKKAVESAPPEEQAPEVKPHESTKSDS